MRLQKHYSLDPESTPNLRIEFSPPPPTLNFLNKDFCLQPGLGWKFLLRRTCCRGKNCSHCSFQDFQSLGFLSKDPLPSQPESDGKSADVGGGGRIGISIQCETWRQHPPRERGALRANPRRGPKPQKEGHFGPDSVSPKPHPCNMPQAKTEVALQFSESCSCRNYTATFAFLQCGSHFYQKLRCSKRTCIATLKKLRCRKEELSCHFPADFRLPRLGTHV